MGTTLEIQNLTVGYAAPVVRELSFSAEAGELVGILGRNGCGKTTLLRGMTGGARVFGGAVRVNGEDCLALRPRTRAKRLALLPQRTEVLPGLCAGEVIEMGLYARGGLFGAPDEAGRARVRRAAEGFGIADRLDTDCARLSEGQRQLVQLARVAVQDAPVLLLDEPDAALDFYNTHLLFRTVRGWLARQGKAAAVVLHDPALALRWCDRLLLLKDGRAAGCFAARGACAADAQAALRRLYPEICVKQDKETGVFHCVLEPNVENSFF
ncbi:MAG: ABC transporter ATP-binding protein [Eubacteriales bacterium]|nr:ABC transporter ATP-binding protein [Eubacteriales bacterium]